MFRACLVAMFCLCVLPARAGLFDDDEARKAILDLRQRVEASTGTAERRLTEETDKLHEENAQLRRGLLDLQNQIESLKTDMAGLRGQGEQLARDLAEMQRRQKDLAQGIDERMARLEPVKASIDGREFTVEPAEKRDYEAALASFKKGDFAPSLQAFAEFQRRYPQSGYGPSALFWMGNAQYATRDYRDAITNFRSLLNAAPDHVRAPEALLSIANCQIELKDARSARKTLEDLVKIYPQSEAASAAKDRLAKIK
jgi:tol-pal system protein YbgF